MTHCMQRCICGNVMNYTYFRSRGYDITCAKCHRRYQSKWHILLNWLNKYKISRKNSS